MCIKCVVLAQCNLWLCTSQDVWFIRTRSFSRFCNTFCRLLTETRSASVHSIVPKRSLNVVKLLSKLWLCFSFCMQLFCYWFHDVAAPCGAGAPLFPPCPFTSSSFPPFYFSLSFIGFTYFLLFSIPSLSTRIVPLRFQAGGCRKRPNLGLVCFVLSVFLSLDVFWCFVVFGLVFIFVVCSFSALTLLVGSFDQ